MNVAFEAHERPLLARATVSPPRGRVSAILLSMVLAIAALGGIALWDEQRESAAALQDFSEDQTGAAQAVAAALAARLWGIEATARAIVAERSLPAQDASGLRVSPHEGGVTASAGDAQTFRWTMPTRDGQLVDLIVPLAALADTVRRTEQPGSVVVLLRRPGEAGFVSTSGMSLRSAILDDATTRNVPWLRLERAEAAQLGLPSRTAAAGTATVQTETMGMWGVVVAATALRERDREIRAVWRLALGFSVASGLVLAFGSVALRKQRKELGLVRELALAEAMQARDERLVRADKLATLGALGTGIAHEVSTPLGVIVGRAEQLVPKLQGDERARRSVEAILEQAERISRIIRGFLGLARGGTPSLERVTAHEVARGALDLVEHRFTKAGVHLSVQLDERLPRIACDPKLFEQVLVNLLLNACDACDRGGHVELAVTSDRQRVAFIVTDDGTGITPETARRAAEPFFTTKAAGEGTGLGLAIANEIVKHHHGELSLSSREKTRGTRAMVDIAAIREEHDA